MPDSNIHLYVRTGELDNQREQMLRAYGVDIITMSSEKDCYIPFYYTAFQMIEDSINSTKN